MFTGIIQAVGSLQAIEPKAGDHRMVWGTGKLPTEGLVLGDSIAVSGVCLTAIALGSASFTADVSGETLARTTLGSLRIGDRVNLELALTPTTRLGGHLVSGHVDGVGSVSERREDGRSIRFRFTNPPALAKYIAEKGSICVDGISLTVNAVGTDWFEVNIVPHTLAETTLGEAVPGRKVNLEVDLLARYLERLFLGSQDSARRTPLGWEALRKAGFIEEPHEHD